MFSGMINIILCACVDASRHIIFMPKMMVLLAIVSDNDDNFERMISKKSARRIKVSKTLLFNIKLHSLLIDLIIE